MNHMIIMQGVSGSGKSTYAKTSIAGLAESHIVSADDYFLKGGVYRFAASRLDDAHAQCFRDALRYLATPNTRVIVDNTNTSLLEIAPYIMAAKSYGASIAIFSMACDLHVAHKRCVHSVPFATIEQQASRIAESLRTWPTRWPRPHVISNETGEMVRT